MNIRRLWYLFAAVLIGSFAVLGYYGRQIYREAPPIPDAVQTANGGIVFTGQQIKDGQNVWQSMGGQEVGTVWGHGAYVAPDWSADWLHREALHMLNAWAQAEQSRKYEELDESAQAALQARLTKEIRTNSYDPRAKSITIPETRAQAIAAVSLHYDQLFSDHPDKEALRDAYAIPANSVKDAERRKALNAFFFWASWTCATNRPNQNVTYTNNWPAEELIGNRPTGPIVVWSVISFVLLLAGIAALAWYFAAERSKESPPHPKPETDPLLALTPTPSMSATLKYFWVVAALLLVQLGLGAVTAHYGVEGSGFYGIPFARWLPYSVTRTWHVQLGIFWIATAWLATGLFMAPAVSGYEPKWQKTGVNLLFFCLLGA